MKKIGHFLIKKEAVFFLGPAGSHLGIRSTVRTYVPGKLKLEALISDLMYFEGHINCL